jgi:MFS family permease
LAKGFALAEIGILVALYPMVWGMAQLATGKLSDLICQKDLLILGMLFQGIALFGLIISQTFWHFASLSVFLGLGTAMVYPNFMAAVAQNTHPEDRAESLGVFRLWRDLGYAVGALMTGILMAYFPVWVSIASIGTLTIISAGVIKIRMRC